MVNPNLNSHDCSALSEWLVAYWLPGSEILVVLAPAIVLMSLAAMVIGKRPMRRLALVGCNLGVLLGLLPTLRLIIDLTVECDSAAAIQYIAAMAIPLNIVSGAMLLSAAVVVMMSIRNYLLRSK